MDGRCKLCRRVSVVIISAPQYPKRYQGELCAKHRAESITALDAMRNALRAEIRECVACNGDVCTEHLIECSKLGAIPK